jgi:hypothetical protein
MKIGTNWTLRTTGSPLQSLHKRIGITERILTIREETLTQDALSARQYTRAHDMGSNVPLRKTPEARRFACLMIATASFLSAFIINISDVSAMGPVVGRATVVNDSDVNSAVLVVVVRRGAVARRTTVVGPRGGVASRTVVRRGAVVRPGVVPPGAWVRPTWYRWAPGGAIAAGAALGFVTAATAVAWAGAPPAAGYCWYYTDASRQQGFWDACPR